MPPALVEAAAVVTIAVTAGRVQAAFTREPGITAAQWRQVAGLLTLKEVSGGVAVAVWLVLAWAIGHRPDLRSLRNTQHRGLVVPYRALGWREHLGARAGSGLPEAWTWAGDWPRGWRPAETRVGIGNPST